MPRRTLVVAILVVAAGAAVWLGAPRWVSIEDPLRDCPTVVVLNGDFPFRADEGARLHRAGRAREVWLTDDPSSADQHGDAGTRSNARRLVERGVPAPSIHVVRGAARGTRAELLAVAEELRRRRFDCAVLVTSAVHMTPPETDVATPCRLDAGCDRPGGARGELRRLDAGRARAGGVAAGADRSRALRASGQRAVESVDATHVRTQRRGDRHAAVGLLVVLEHGDDRAADGEPGAVERRDELGLAAARPGDTGCRRGARRTRRSSSTTRSPCTSPCCGRHTSMS